MSDYKYIDELIAEINGGVEAMTLQRDELVVNRDKLVARINALDREIEQRERAIRMLSIHEQRGPFPMRIEIVDTGHWRVINSVGELPMDMKFKILEVNIR